MRAQRKIAIIFLGIPLIGLLAFHFVWPLLKSDIDIPISEKSEYPPKNMPPWQLGATAFPPKSTEKEFLDCSAMAQSKIDKFINAVTSPSDTQTGFGICVKLTGEDFNTIDYSNDLYWLVDVRHVDGRFFGSVISDYCAQQYFDSGIRAKRGDVLDVAATEVVDWVYFDKGEMIGAYTAECFHAN